jgi:aspartyl/asparaginyl beta-hydroxylase/tetratricopeptide repeat protein
MRRSQCGPSYNVRVALTCVITRAANAAGTAPLDVAAGKWAKLPAVQEALDIGAVIAAGFEALRGADPHTARESFTRAIAARGDDATAWYGLSVVHRMIGTAAEESAALDQSLRIDPRHVPALIAKGDSYARTGNLPAATSYYHAVLKLAGAQPRVPEQMRAELQRIAALCERFEREYQSHVLTSLSSAGLATSIHPRFTHALDLLFGKRQIYFQQPKYFFYPELPQIQFYDRGRFSWIPLLERQTEAIRSELRGILASGGGFVPYIQTQADRPSFSAGGLLNNPQWSACYLIKDGIEVAENAARCPTTMAALRDVPLCRISGRTPSVLFSLLRPGARIHPHHGFTNTRLIGHLPLIVPGGCALRVGNETRPWREGEALLFDDSIEHEAWNSSAELRVILLFDIWRPELSAEERRGVATLLESIDRFGPRREWTD